MSVYTTLNLTESKAKALLFEHHFGQLSTQELEAQLDQILAPRLYNALVVPDGSANNDDHYV